MACESSFSTIELVGEMINEDPDLLRQISVEMEPEDGCVAIYGKNDENIIAFSVTAPLLPRLMRLDCPLLGPSAPNSMAAIRPAC